MMFVVGMKDLMYSVVVWVVVVYNGWNKSVFFWGFVCCCCCFVCVSDSLLYCGTLYWLSSLIVVVEYMSYNGIIRSFGGNDFYHVTLIKKCFLF